VQRKLKEMRATPVWEKIYDDTQKYINNGLESFQLYFKDNIIFFYNVTKKEEIYSKLRLDELLRSCADDLYRYVTYHKVANKEGNYEIAEAIHASYIVKWVMHFRPLLLDEYKNYEEISKHLDKLFTENQEETDLAKFFRYGNEKYAVFVASECLNLVSKDEKSKHLLLEFMKDGQELKDFDYTLRYRACHQDLYRALFRRIVDSYIGYKSSLK